MKLEKKLVNKNKEILQKMMNFPSQCWQQSGAKPSSVGCSWECVMWSGDQGGGWERMFQRQEFFFQGK